MSIATNEPMRKRARLNITKNTRGYSYERTAEVEWTDGSGMAMVAEMMADLDTLAREEIATCEELDDSPSATRDEVTHV